MHYGGDPQFSVNLSHDLIKYRVLLQREEFLTAKQTKVDLKQFRRISRDVTDCDKGLAAVKKTGSGALPP